MLKLEKSKFIIGTGISGLSAACYGLKNKKKIKIFEGASHSGGRCRSYHDKTLDLEVDNGNHLILSANKNFLNFCKLIDSFNTLAFYESKFYFFDFQDKSRWSVEINDSFFPYWIFNKKKRIPKSALKDYFEILKILFARPDQSVYELLGGKSILFKTFWEPLTLGIMNSDCTNASAFLLSSVIKKSFLKGGKFCSIYQPKISWDNTLIKPSINYIKKKGCSINYKSILKKIVINNGVVTKLQFQKDEIEIKKNDDVILSLPPNSLSKILPNIKLPKTFNTILNIHYKINKSLQNELNIPILGVLNSITHWVFIKKGYISVTISAANKYNNVNSEIIAKDVWAEVSQSLKIDNKVMPEYKVLREKNATYEQSPENYKMIQNINDLPKNLRLAGDWTEKFLPSTIESSILSGKKAITNV